jgi:hypothetical protein
MLDALNSMPCVSIRPAVVLRWLFAAQGTRSRRFAWPLYLYCPLKVPLKKPVRFFIGQLA